MNLFTTKIHGIFDYICALTLLIMPWLMGFEDTSCEAWLATALGATAFLYSFCTDYEWGFLEEIDIRTHLLLDFLVGVILVIAPWLFSFYDRVYIPYVVMGVVEISLTFLTKIDNGSFQNIATGRRHT